MKRLYAKWKDFVTDDLEDMTTGGEISKDQPDQNSYGTPLREYKILSYFGRLNYSLLDRYLFEANLRADASSRFHKDNRWGSSRLSLPVGVLRKKILLKT